MEDQDSLAWALVANRVYDMGSCSELQKHVSKQPKFAVESLREFYECVKQQAETGEWLAGNPTGVAMVHSGFTWLRTMCKSRAAFGKFALFVSNVRNNCGTDMVGLQTRKRSSGR